jgi:hypothetical protein
MGEGVRDEVGERELTVGRRGEKDGAMSGWGEDRVQIG